MALPAKGSAFLCFCVIYLHLVKILDTLKGEQSLQLQLEQ